MALATIATESAKKAALGMARGRNISQQLRGGLLRNTQSSPNNDNSDEGQQPSVYKSRLAMLKSGAIKEANKQGGAAAGAAAGGAIGSVIPVVGTGIGAFIGRFVGKKLGITGIIIMVILMNIFFIVMFIAIFKGYCDDQGIIAGYGTKGAAFFGVPGATSLVEACKALGS